MSEGQTSAGRVVLDVVLYVAARLLLVVVLGVVIYGAGRLLGVDVPVVVAVLFALVIALPLGIWMFAPLRRRATAGLHAVSARRRREREQLRSRLRGDTPPPEQ